MNRNWMLVLVLILALVVSACGNDGSADDAALVPAGENAGGDLTATDVAGSAEDVAAATATAATAALEAAATATPLAGDVAAGVDAAFARYANHVRRAGDVITPNVK